MTEKVKTELELEVEEELGQHQYCFGCGVRLQTENPHERGYVPQNVLANNGPVLCQRCFKIQHYAEDKNSEVFDKEGFLKILDKAKEENAIIVYVVDLFSFEASFIPEINERLANMDVILVANKRDILPRSVDDEKLKAYVLKRAEDVNINVVDIGVTSASKNYNIDSFMHALMSLRNNGNVYFVGSASAGKSSLINTLLKNYSNETSNFITTSPYPGTTINVIEIPIDDVSYIYDTPGLTVYNSMLNAVDKNVINLITPKTEIKPKTYQLESKQSLLLGGLAYIDFVEGPRSNFTVYASNMVQISRSRMSRAQDVFDTFVRTKQIKPISSTIKSHHDLVEHSFVLQPGKKYDVGISGYGWISTQGNGQKLIVHAPNNVSVYICDAKI